MTHYARGANFERQVKGEWEGAGYFVARCAGSHGVADLVAVALVSVDGCCRRVYFIQCKTGGALSRTDWNALYAMAERHGAIPVLAYREKRKHVYARLTKCWTKRNRPKDGMEAICLK